MVMLRLTAEQYRRLPILADESTCSGKTYVITGGNSGLGLETARHLVEFSASQVILAVRNLTAGEEAKKEIESSTGRTGVVQVWHIDMASQSSIQSFVTKATKELDRIDGFVANAGVMTDKWSTTEGMETSMQINVVNTLFLAVLMMPKLSDIASKLGIHPTLTFIVSVLGYTAKAEMDKNRDSNIFQSLNNQEKASLDQRCEETAIFGPAGPYMLERHLTPAYETRYALTKLVEELAARQLAVTCPVERTGVVVNMVAPGLCHSGLGRDVTTATRVIFTAIKAMMARTAEVGSRTILHGIVAGEESHGKLLSGCKIKEYWVPTWVSDDEGQKLQKAVWEELVDKYEAVQPGCVSRLSSV